MATQQIRVLIAQQNPRLNEGLAQALNREPDLDIVATAATMVEAVTRTVDLHPDVLLLDRDLPGGTDVDLSAVIRYLRPDTRLVFVGDDDRSGVRSNYTIRSVYREREIVDVVRDVGRRSTSAIRPSYGKSQRSLPRRNRDEDSVRAGTRLRGFRVQ